MHRPLRGMSPRKVEPEPILVQIDTTPDHGPNPRQSRLLALSSSVSPDNSDCVSVSKIVRGRQPNRLADDEGGGDATESEPIHYNGDSRNPYSSTSL
jgi:hypothetical protein